MEASAEELTISSTGLSLVTKLAVLPSWRGKKPVCPLIVAARSMRRKVERSILI